MNGNNLERQLRSEPGPRERGYVPSRLPASLEEADLDRPSRLVRAAVLVPAVAAGIVVVAVGAALLRGSGAPSGVGTDGPTATPLASMPTETATPTAEPTPIPTGELAPCMPEDLGRGVEQWGGAAGSRGTVVTLRPAAGPCRLDQPFEVSIGSSAPGDVLARGQSPAGATSSVTLDTEHWYRIGVSWTNYCGERDLDAVGVTLVFPAWRDARLEIVPDGQAVLPPCMDETAAASVSVTELQPVP